MKTFALFLLSGLLCAQSTNPVVRFQTNLGDIDVELYADVAPKTVANFFNYINKGAYANTIIHRSVANFVVQGGGYKISAQSVDTIPSDAPVVNEPKISNTRGTIAMAKVEGNPNSATNQWFFNLRDSNAENLDRQNGGFTVFGKITDAAGLAVMDRIAAVQTYNSPYSDSLPLINYQQGRVVQPSNFIVIQAIRPLGRAISAGAFGGYIEAAIGSYIEVYGTDLADTTRTWAESDFSNNVAPTTLDEVSATVGGRPAFISYISPTQVNIQVPEGVTPGNNVPVVLRYKDQDRALASLNIKAAAPGLLAPSSFKVGDYQFVAALHSNGTFVANSAIAGVPAAPALPGETLIIYGLGFGPVTGDTTTVAGRIAQGLTSTAAPVQFFFDGMEAQVSYRGLAPGFVGLYQFNVVVPPGLAGGRDVTLRVTVGGENLAQTLYIPIR
jgi:uncharacterized protein (TIGR03437 family)